MAGGAAREPAEPYGFLPGRCRRHPSQTGIKSVFEEPRQPSVSHAQGQVGGFGAPTLLDRIAPFVTPAPSAAAPLHPQCSPRDKCAPFAPQMSWSPKKVLKSILNTIKKNEAKIDKQGAKIDEVFEQGANLNSKFDAESSQQKLQREKEDIQFAKQDAERTENIRLRREAIAEETAKKKKTLHDAAAYALQAISDLAATEEAREAEEEEKKQQGIKLDQERCTHPHCTPSAPAQPAALVAPAAPVAPAVPAAPIHITLHLCTSTPMRTVIHSHPTTSSASATTDAREDRSRRGDRREGITLISRIVLPCTSSTRRSSRPAAPSESAPAAG